MTHRLLPSTRSLIERLKEERHEDYYLRNQTVAFGKGKDVVGDVCFARMSSVINVNSLKTLHFLFRNMSPAVDYPALIDDADRYFSKLYNIAYFPATDNISIAQINSKEKYSVNVDNVFYRIILSLFRAADKEFTDKLKNFDALSIKTLKDLIIKWNHGTGGTTSHTINESLVYTYRRYMDDDKFSPFVDIWLEKLMKLCGENSVFQQKEITQEIESEVDRVKDKYYNISHISQSPSYMIVETSLQKLEEKYATKNSNV